MSGRPQARRDTAATWIANNPTLAAGEEGLESDTGLFKTGDGATAWTSLLYQGQQVFRLSGNGGAIGNGIADFFTNGNFSSLAAAAAYEIEAELFFTKTTAGTVVFTLTTSQTMVNFAGNYEGGPVAGIATAGAPIAAAIAGTTSGAFPATSSLTTGVNHHFRLRATVDTHATLASTLKLQATESAGTITPLRGSVIYIRRLPNANIGAFA